MVLKDSNLGDEAELAVNMLVLSKLLLLRDFKLATSESCTGGWVAKAATDLPGSSLWFDRGIVTYSNAAKTELLGVKEETLKIHGAVSKQTVEEMVGGLLSAKPVSIGVAISGVAGPDGGSNEKPVGTVWIAWQIQSNPAQSQCYLFSGDREQVRLQASIEAVVGLIRVLKNDQ